MRGVTGSHQDFTDLDAVDLESVISTVELERRPRRPPDLASENRALVALAEAMTAAPDGILPNLAQTALDLCRAHSAGISLLEGDPERFRWAAVAGQWAPYLGGGNRRDSALCGTVLDRDVPLLFSRPERYFKYLASVKPCVEEGLLIPFRVGGRAIGTIWVMAHDPSRRFDAEDLRVMNDLAHFAAAAYAACSRQVAIRADARSAALRRSEAFLSEAQRLSSTGSFLWHVPTDEITWSEQLYRIYELDQNVPVTRELIAGRVHPEDLASVQEMAARAHACGYPFENEHRLQMPDRSVKYLHMVAHAIRDQDGQLEYIGAVQDVTERRLSEETLGRVRSELARVARVTTLGALTASIAHEVNQPLSGIITNASTCLRMLAADPPNVDGARETARRTIRDGQRASDVIARLRALFSKKGTTTESVDLNEATREVIALSRSELQRSRVVLRSELADDLLPVKGDRVQLQQVILNLLRNATDAMSGIDDRPRQLVIRTERDEGAHARLSVQDAGMGFEPKDADRLFEAFYTTKSDGMGIGLSVSRSIIESHHGRLWAAPNDGPGATFSFSIPPGRPQSM
jgi:signal transduction histidine kinase